MTYEEAKKKLTPYGQEHLLSFYDTLNEEEQRNLLRQIEELDLSFLDLLKDKDTPADKDVKIEPLKALSVSDIQKKSDNYRAIGLKAIRERKTAAVLLAGGQGTRLGFNHPKGMYNVGETHDLFIFECLIRNLLEVVREAGAYIPLYIMTSEINHDETVNFFKEHNYFGYDPNEIRFFVQEMAPATDFNGKILLESPSRIATSPNGNGGWYHSMKKAGLDKDLREKGIEYLSSFAVDNVLQRINDPIFVGATIASNVDVGAKVIVKADPNERVGVLCMKNGHPSIVEYYEMTDDMIHLKDENGNLLYAYGVILNYLFKVDCLEKIVSEKMPVHIVEKKIPHINEKGEFIKPETPNGYKFELLILDMIELMDTSLPYEVIREKEFAPIKNPTGVDSVESAKELLKKNQVTL